MTAAISSKTKYPEGPRELTTHIASPADPMRGHVRVFVSDDKGPGGAHHIYNIAIVNDEGYAHSMQGVKFQLGGVKEAGHNGLTIEALLAIVIDRLECFQTGPFPCIENGIALTAIEYAMEVLHCRTQERISRNVEGQSRA